MSRVRFPGVSRIRKWLKALIYKALSHFFQLEKYIDLHRIYTNLMSQFCRKVPF
nr:MAG TPA: hypothetical protein [Caudoviricetes sp.]